MVSVLLTLAWTFTQLEAQAPNPILRPTKTPAPTLGPTPEMAIEVPLFGSWDVTDEPTLKPTNEYIPRPLPVPLYTPSPIFYDTMPVPRKTPSPTSGSGEELIPEGRFEVVSGPCEVKSTCAWRMNYGNNEHCKIRVKENVLVTLEEWDVEREYDSLTLDDVNSMRVPDAFKEGKGFYLSKDSFIYWTTDTENNGTYSGWRVCLDETPAPTQMPTQAMQHKLTWSSQQLLMILVIPTLTFVFCCLVCLAAKYCCVKEEERDELSEPVMENQGQEGEGEEKSRTCWCCPRSEAVSRQFSQVSRMEGERPQVEEILGEQLSIHSEVKSAIEGQEGVEPKQSSV